MNYRVGTGGELPLGRTQARRVVLPEPSGKVGCSLAKNIGFPSIVGNSLTVYRTSQSFYTSFRILVPPSNSARRSPYPAAMAARLRKTGRWPADMQCMGEPREPWTPLKPHCSSRGQIMKIASSFRGKQAQQRGTTVRTPSPTKTPLAVGRIAHPTSHARTAWYPRGVADRQGVPQ